MKNLGKFLLDRKSNIAAALPNHMHPDRMVRIIMTEIRTTPLLKECTPESLVGAMIQTSQLGLEPGNGLGHAYLIPYRNKGVYEVQLQIGYKGLIDLARRSGQLSSIASHCVHDNDELEIEYGINEKLKHVPSRKNRGLVIAAYAVAIMKDGSHQLAFMWADEINQVRNSAQAYKSAVKYNKPTPWITNYEEMAKKTTIRRLCKYLSLSPEMQRADLIDGQADSGNQNIQEAIDIYANETIDIDPDTGEIKGFDAAQQDAAPQAKTFDDINDQIKSESVAQHKPATVTEIRQQEKVANPAVDEAADMNVARELAAKFGVDLDDAIAKKKVTKIQIRLRKLSRNRNTKNRKLKLKKHKKQKKP